MANRNNRLSRLARHVFALDLRSLAAMRIAVGAVVLIDLLVRMYHLTAHYSDRGVLPRADAVDASPLADLSLLAVSGAPAWAGVVFALALACNVAVIVGWRTRLATCLLWLCVLSIQHRNPLLNDHRDALITCALLWGMLLPWGAALSVDARGQPAARPRYVSVPAAGYVLQIACLYLLAALLKSGPEWRSEFSAVYYALSVDYWALPPARTVLEHPRLMQALTVMTVWFEAAIAVLLLCPWRTAALRSAVVIGAIAMHIGFGVCIWLGTFPLISIAAMLGLLPAGFWTLPGVRRLARSGPSSAATDRRAVRVIAACAISYLGVLNALSLRGDPALDDPIQTPAAVIGFTQNWDMFAPSPTRIDGAFVVDGTLASGDRVDLTVPPRTTRELVYARRLLGAYGAVNACEMLGTSAGLRALNHKDREVQVSLLRRAVAAFDAACARGRWSSCASAANMYTRKGLGGSKARVQALRKAAMDHAIAGCRARLPNACLYVGHALERHHRDLDAARQSYVEGCTAVAETVYPAAVDDALNAFTVCQEASRLNAASRVTSARRRVEHVLVSRDALDALRIADEDEIVPYDRVKAQLRDSGETQLRVALRLCVSRIGLVRSLEFQRSSRYPSYNRRVFEAARAWRYRPFTIGDKPIPVCTDVEFSHSPNDPA